MDEEKGCPEWLRSHHVKRRKCELVNEKGKEFQVSLHSILRGHMGLGNDRPSHKGRAPEIPVIEEFAN